MNFLAHLYIADATNTSFAGALLGDFVRGRLDGRHGSRIETGIHLHRRVDTYTDTHPVVTGAFQRLPPPFRRYAGIMVDIYFDHLLARRWAAFHTDSLEGFAENACARMWREWPLNDPPFAAERLADLPALLVSYRHPDGIAEALTRVDQRLSRPSPLPRAWPHLQAHGEGLAADFDRFFPELLAFARNTTGTDQPPHAGPVA